jgi:predicted dehydrogenase
MHSMVTAGGKYFGKQVDCSHLCGSTRPILTWDLWIETPWRKTPEYQGGFLLDGGVHFIAGTRLLLGADNRPNRISAFSTQLQKHLPPVDTVDAIWRTESGISGTFSISFGTTFRGSEYIVACEKGTVCVSRGVVVVTVDGKEEREEFADEGSGVKQEVAAWAAGLGKNQMDKEQSPQEALQDLRVVSLQFSINMSFAKTLSAWSNAPQWRRKRNTEGRWVLIPHPWSIWALDRFRHAFSQQIFVLCGW